MVLHNKLQPYTMFNKLRFQAIKIYLRLYEQTSKIKPATVSIFVNRGLLYDLLRHHNIGLPIL